MTRYLNPADERRDPKFRAELQRLSVTGLRVIAVVFVAAPLFWVAIGHALVFGTLVGVGFRSAVAIFVVGLTAFWLSYWPPAQSRARLLGLVVLYLAVVMDLLGTLEVPVRNADHGGYVSGCVTLGLLLAIAAFPVTPLQTLALGFSLTATYVFILWRVGALAQVGLPTSLSLMFIVLIVLICVGLTAVAYRQRAAVHHARCRAEQAFEELQKAQVRVMVSENAASQCRFAAALSHELNSPLGALTSAFGTIVQVHRVERFHPDDQKRLQKVFDEASGVGLQAVERLKRTFDRMKHLTNLERAEEQIVDLNDLWKDTVALLSGEFEQKAEVGLNLKPLPGVKCRPQQMSAVFSHLLRNALAAIKGHGTIRISSDKTADEIVMEVQDDGMGIPPERLPRLFEPVFQSEDGRVTTTNWGLFITRSIIGEHGGHFEIESEEGRGTTAIIRLPLSLSA